MYWFTKSWDISYILNWYENYFVFWKQIRSFSLPDAIYVFIIFYFIQLFLTFTLHDAIFISFYVCFLNADYSITANATIDIMAFEFA